MVSNDEVIVRMKSLPLTQVRLPLKMHSVTAAFILLVFGYHESELKYRKQGGNGPARGLWQFELNGVIAVMNHSVTKSYVPSLLEDLGLPTNATPTQALDALENNDVLAAGMARLLLWSDPKPLPDICDVDAVWKLYLRTWNPGRRDSATQERFKHAHKLMLECCIQDCLGL